jgi:[protein-PII] uridylyltransferase
VFYVRDVFGMKVEHEGKLQQIRDTLTPILDKANLKKNAPAGAQAAE